MTGYTSVQDLEQEVVRLRNRLAQTEADLRAAKATGRLIEMGQVATIDLDGSRHEYKMALVIEFSSTDSIRHAINAGCCRFSFGDEGTSTP